MVSGRRPRRVRRDMDPGIDLTFDCTDAPLLAAFWKEALVATWALTDPCWAARAQTIAESEVTSPAVTPLVNAVPAAGDTGTRSATAVAAAAIPPNWRRLTPTDTESSRNAPADVRAPTWFWCRRSVPATRPFAT